MISGSFGGRGGGVSREAGRAPQVVEWPERGRNGQGRPLMEMEQECLMRQRFINKRVRKILGTSLI